MIGLTKEDIERIIRAYNIDHEHKEIAGTLREECRELDPWIPIESAPKDRELWLYDTYGIHGEGVFSDLFNKFVFVTDKYDPIIAVKWKELPLDPTCENFADT